MEFKIIIRKLEINQWQLDCLTATERALLIRLGKEAEKQNEMERTEKRTRQK